MRSTLKIPLLSEIRFPESCLVCSGPGTKSRNLIASRQIARNGKSESVTVTLCTKMCPSCFARDSKIFFVTFLPLLLFGIIGAAASFWITLPYTPEVQSSTNPALGLALPLAAALFGGLLTGSIAEVIARLFAFPFIGRAIFGLPLFLTELLSNKASILGLIALISADGKEIELTFSNPTLAEKVRLLNLSDTSS